MVKTSLFVPSDFKEIFYINFLRLTNQIFYHWLLYFSSNQRNISGQEPICLLSDKLLKQLLTNNFIYCYHNRWNNICYILSFKFYAGPSFLHGFNFTVRDYIHEHIIKKKKHLIYSEVKSFSLIYQYSTFFFFFFFHGSEDFKLLIPYPLKQPQNIW